MKFHKIASAAFLGMLILAPLQAAGGQEKPAPEKKADDLLDLPPLSADKTVRQSVRIGDRVIAYDATVGTIPVRDEKGRVIADVTYTAYTVPGGDTHRPVTFAFNGGPGASSVYLNLGAIGPKRVQFGAQGNAPSDAPVVTDYAISWFDFSELVFIDPVGTCFSRSLLDAV